MKRKLAPRMPHAGAKPLHYVDGRLYYVKNEMIDKIANIPSQQKHPKPAAKEARNGAEATA